MGHALLQQVAQVWAAGVEVLEQHHGPWQGGRLHDRCRLDGEDVPAPDLQTAWEGRAMAASCR